MPPPSPSMSRAPEVRRFLHMSYRTGLTALLPPGRPSCRSETPRNPPGLVTTSLSDDLDLHTLGLGDGIEIPVHQGVSPLLGPLELDGREGAGHRRRHSLPSLTGNPLLEHGDILEPTGVKPAVTRTDRLPVSVTH